MRVVLVPSETLVNLGLGLLALIQPVGVLGVSGGLPGMLVLVEEFDP